MKTITALVILCMTKLEQLKVLKEKKIEITATRSVTFQLYGDAYVKNRGKKITRLTNSMAHQVL